jgi:hypothetical protein
MKPFTEHRFTDFDVPILTCSLVLWAYYPSANDCKSQILSFGAADRDIMNRLHNIALASLLFDLNIASFFSLKSYSIPFFVQEEIIF